MEIELLQKMMLTADKIEQRLDAVHFDLVEVGQRLRRVGDGLAVIDGRLERLDARLERVEHKLGAAH